MAWQGIIDTYRKREPELLAELDRADRSGPGSVEWNPSFPLPSYFANVEFHIQPGSYHADPLAGYIYHYGTKLLFQSRNDYDDLHREYVALAPAPPDGVVRRVLDLACSIGQSTTALKERFPNAEVWGIDAGAPMVRYAHKRAVEMGCDVHFAQRLAEETGFPDDSFDLVYSYILFHELPVAITEQVVREAYRILRPGGLFVTLDVANRPPTTAGGVAEYYADFVTYDNGEPYYTEFVRCDFPAIHQAAGFSTFTADAQGASTSGTAGLPVRVAMK
jgi:SAM-dependent methyltransferase